VALRTSTSAVYGRRPMTPYKLCVLPFLLLPFAVAQTPSTKEVASVYPEAHCFYLDLHQNPELLMHETQTAAKLA
jgi:hypothetical protein